MSNDQPESSGRRAAIRSEARVIYDLGANNGDDIPYYLKKAELVVAVEANPVLCEQMEQRYRAEIRGGRLRIENCVVAGEGSDPEVYFYLHKRHHVLGQFPQPVESVINDYEKARLPSEPVKQLLCKFGSPYYIKIDLEGYDEVILREILQQGFRPPYISAESTNIQIFALLAGLGEYKAFKLVEGATVQKEYSNHLISANGGQERYSFPPHSAGPFGEDIRGEWMNADDLFEILAAKKMGWRDIHATNLFEPDPTPQTQKRRYLYRHFRGWMQARTRSRKNNKKDS